MLDQLRPDLLLVEGPPEAESMLPWVGTADLVPPVAVLCYDEAHPSHAVFYPFAEFSPEWQAISWANRNHVPVRLMDLPVAISWEMHKLNQDQSNRERPSRDPISWFAEIGGFANSDQWWEHHFEQKFISGAASEHFEAVNLVMHTLRQAGIESFLDRENTFREAYMAQLIRKAQNEMYQNIAVVCGAWHAPALENTDRTEKAHAAVLKQLPKTKIKVKASWIPWTNSRLAMESGYGAGIASPGWYRHLWEHPEDNGQRWLIEVARLFREKKMDISTSHVIESFRLAESLAALRNLTRPGLTELNEATTTVMCMGDSVLLKLIEKELIVGHALGKVPADLPRLPLQADFETQTRSMRLSLTADDKSLDLDLRKELDRKRSVFFFRLQILGIPWAVQTESSTRGTFKESWDLSWNPEMIISLIQMGIWGNTVEEASLKYLSHQAQESQFISELSELIQKAIPAELFDAIELLLDRISEAATVSSDLLELMGALVPLAAVSRYGNVRKTDLEAALELVEGLLIRICIGLPPACYGLDEESAEKMFSKIRQVHDSLRQLENTPLSEMWFDALDKTAQREDLPPLISGCTCRLLLDARRMDRSEADKRFSFALSSGQDPAHSAAWIEGFLKSSGMILLYDDVLWNLLHSWLALLPLEVFDQLLPILRRTFAKFSEGERNKLGEKAKRGLILPAENNETSRYSTFDLQLAEQVLSGTARLLGLQLTEHDGI
jgi:hypothetical protein